MVKPLRLVNHCLGDFFLPLLSFLFVSSQFSLLSSTAIRYWQRRATDRNVSSIVFVAEESIYHIALHASDGVYCDFDGKLCSMSIVMELPHFHTCTQHS